MLSLNTISLDLSADGTTLTVAEDTPTGVCVARWCIQTILFGPKAYIAFPRPQRPETNRVILIRNATFGLQSGLEIALSLTGQPATSPAWSIAVGGNMWGGPSEWTARPVGFQEFANGTRSVPLEVRAAAVGRFADRAFGGLFEVAAGDAGLFRLSLSRDGTWRLRGNAPAHNPPATGWSTLKAFDRAVEMTGIDFGWKVSHPQGSDRPYALFSARSGPDAITIASPLRLGSANGHHLTLAIKPDHRASLEAQIGPAALKPSALQAAIGLHLTYADLTVRFGDRPLAGPVPVNGVTITATTLPDGTGRSVLWADAMRPPAQATQSPHPRATDQTPARVVQRLIDSPIGRIRVGPPDLEAIGPEEKQPAPTSSPAPADAQACGCAPLQVDSSPDESSARFFRTASGDRAGAPSAGVFAVHDVGTGLRRITVELSMFGVSVAPPDTSYSRLDFERADLRLHFEDGRPLFPDRREYPRQLASSWIWVGPHDDASSAPRAALDLSRATLTCARDYDLAKLRLRFSDLVLGFAPHPQIRPARDDCRVLVHDGTIEDSRPTLVAEFDPQHVFEQAVFRPNPRPLPDVELTVEKLTRQDIIQNLSALEEPKRTAYRVWVRNQKIKEATDTAFRDFVSDYENDSRVKVMVGDRKDQLVYIGPFALDPDLMGLARTIQKQKGDAAIIRERDTMLTDVDKMAVGSPTSPASMQDALRRESVLEQLEPVYGLYREFWREIVARAMTHDSQINLDLSGDDPKTIPTEYLTPSNRPSGYPPPIRVAQIQAVVNLAFVDFAAGRDDVEDLVAARLSGASRLAFRINCTPLAGLDASEAGLSGESGDGPRRLGSGSAKYAPLKFSFAALTDWSRHEPCVTRRARKLFEPLATGLLPPLGNRGAQAGDTDILHYQGISKGVVTVDQRMTEIRNSLVPPTAWETAIEVPARLTLSTAQDAIWLTNRRLLREKPQPDRLEAGESIAPVQPVEVRPPHRLWTARLSVADALPGLRAVWSPDLRPMALGPWSTDTRGKLPGHAAPPRGPWAPWFIGLEQGESGTITPQASASDPKFTCDKPKGFSLLRWLCQRQADAKQIPSKDYRLFRATLDAWDRHQIVLQSSAYGLPVTGARVQVGNDVNDSSGGLIAQSGQFEPTDDYMLLDAADRQAVYRPIPLDVRELSLTALGGSLLHDTRFIPASGVALLDGGTSFDGFSIQRWQHEVVLGRDMRAEVVYKGYLMPFCHRASLVKLTERIFLRTKADGIKAILRQRLFLRMVRGVTFPQVGQPYYGRLWCSSAVTLKLDRTPDLLDPTRTLGSAGGNLYLSGKVDIGSKPGLVFWPRTDVTPNGLYRFDCDLSGPTTRLPMMFLDKVAATNPESLKAAVAHYDQEAPIEWRTLPLGGQKIRYANEDKPGDTTFVSDWIKVRVHGRNTAELQDAATWTGALDDYANNSVLEGADQPPFYAAMDEARIRFDQVERLTGAPARASVQYDGHYIRHGMPCEQDPAAELSSEDRNPAAVFLDLRESIRLDMGSNGDRSGGIGRPNTSVVAISRSHGPLGAGAPVSWRDGRGAVLARKTPDVDPIVLLEEDKFTLSSGLVSLARQFNVDARAIDMPEFKDAGASRTSPKKDLLASLFSSDAKLLGIIKFTDLLQWVADATDIPALKDAIKFGAAATAAAEAELDKLAAEVRVRVLQPLRVAIERIRADWSKLDEKLHGVGGQGATMAQLFPDIASALTDLSASVDAALATQDAFELQDKLGQVFASAGRLVHGLTAAAQHPVERLKDGVVALLAQLGANLGQSVEDMANAFFGAVAMLSQPLATSLDQGAWVVSHVLDGLGDQTETELSAALPVSLPVPQLSVVAATMVDGTDQATQTFLASVKQVQDQLERDIPKASRDLLNDVVKNVLAQALTGKQSDYATTVRPALRAYLAALRGTIKQGALQALSRIDASATDALERVKALLISVLQAYLDKLDDQLADELALVQPDLATLVQGVERARRAAADLHLLMDDAAGHRFDQVFRDAATLSADLFGIDAASLADALLAPVVQLVAGAAKAAQSLAPVPSDAAAFRADVAACSSKDLMALPRQNSAGTVVASAPLLVEIGQAIEAARNLATPAGTAAQQLGQHRDEIAKADPSANVDALIATCNAAAALGDGTAADLIKLDCDIVEAMALLNQAPLAPPPPRNADALRQYGALFDQLRRIAATVASRLADIAARLQTFVVAHGPTVAGAGLIADALSALGKAIPVDSLKHNVDTAEQGLTQGLTAALDAGVTAIQSGAADASAALAALTKALNDLQGFATSLNTPLGPEAAALAKALQRLTDLMASRANWKHPSVAQPATIAALLAAPLGDGQTVATYFTANLSPFAADLQQVRLLQSQCVSLAHAVTRVASGLPGRLQDAVALQIVVSGLLTGLARAAKGVQKLRDDAYAKAQGVPLLKRTASSWLIANPDQSCVQSGPLETCDQLSTETELLQSAASADPLDAAMRKKLLAYLGNWSNKKAAPQIIFAQAQSAFQDLARGNILAVLDLSAYRDAIEDAIRNLIPVKATLSYDFATTINQGEPDGAPIFQPQADCPFSIASRGEVDLLNPDKNSFSAVAHIGPFDINLVGEAIKALRLHFGGASFEVTTGAKPRFDVQYTSFELLELLKFAEQLETYLSPKGDGIFIQPLTSGIGLEAGYSVDLGILSIGETSFFNVKLGVSAELPFDKGEAIFKVSLGRRLAPFTMSVLPFAGSGFFSILADANGPRGFEASFEFGAGGSIGFGPLTAQARVQVGVYFRLERADDGRVLTSFFGTFFAGGSASIWIFSFSTSLAVRLGQAAGGSMYGEAVFTFSFSLGLCDYDFSVTAFHEEQPVGNRKSGGGVSWNLQNGVQLAASDQPRIMSDVDPAFVRQVNSIHPARQSPRPAPALLGQANDWDAYAGYFDTTLLPECQVGGHH